MAGVVAAEAALDLRLGPFGYYGAAVGAAGAVIGLIESVEEGLGFPGSESVVGPDGAVAGRAGEERVAAAFEGFAAAVGRQLFGQVREKRGQRFFVERSQSPRQGFDCSAGSSHRINFHTDFRQ